MSRLQLSLLVLGAALIVGVLLFNWLQEWQLRRKTEASFKRGQPEDVLLGARVEPQLGGTSAESRVAPPEGLQLIDATDLAQDAGADGIDPMLDYLVTLGCSAAVTESALQQAQQQSSALGKMTQCYGLNAATGQWELCHSGADYTQVKATLQIADRAGPVSLAQLNRFCEIWRDCASGIGAALECPPTVPVLAVARELDRFGGEVDVEIGLNVVAKEGATFSATKIRALAESAGGQLEADGIFYYYDEHGHTLFTLHNQGEPFFAEHIKMLTTHGITFLLELPRVAESWRVFDRMATLAKNIAVSLGGRLVDDNGAQLNEAGLESIRTPLRALHAGMDARQISAGSRRALRLFA